MASIDELKKRAKGLNVTKDEEEKKEETDISSRIQSLKDRAKNANNISTKLSSSEVDDWYNAAYSVGNRVYNYLSSTGYKTPNADFLTEIDTYLAKADDVAHYLSVNKNNYTDYDSVVKSHYEMVNYLRNLKSGVTSSNDYFSSWESKDAWFKGSTENWEARQQQYESNKKRIEELEAQRNSIVPTATYNPDSNAFFPIFDPVATAKRKEIDAEIERLKTENQQYERGEGSWVNKTVDDNYHVTQREDFYITSANRDYSNPAPDEYSKYAAYNDQSKWYFDENGVYRDAYGNALEVDEVGNWVNPMNKDMPIEDKLGMFLNASEKERNQAAAGTWGINNITDTFREGIEGDWKYLTDTEIGIYYTYLGESQEKAYQYLNDMARELNRRRTLDEIGEWYGEYEEAGFLEKIGMSIATVPAQLLSGVGGTVSNVIDTLQGEEINPYSTAHSGMHYSQTVRGARAEEFSDVKLLGDYFTAGDLYQSGMSMLDSFAAIGIGGNLGSVILASSAAQSEAYRLYQQGASSTQIALGSTAAFAAELVFESLSIGNLDKIKNMASPKTFGQYVKTVLVQGGVEASEEVLTEIANTVTNAFIMASQSDWSKSVDENGLGQTFLNKALDVIHAGLSGFVSGTGSGAIVGGPSYLGQQARFAKTGKAIKAADGGINALQDLANEVAGVSEGKMKRSLTKRAGKVSQKSSNAKVGYFYDTVQTANNVANTSANQADIAKSLQRKGISADTANDIAAALVAQYNGQPLTKAQEKLLESAKNNPAVQKAISNIVNNDQSTMGQRQQNIRDFQQDVRDGVVASASGLSVGEYRDIVKAAQLSQETAAEAPTTESGYEVSVDGKTIDKVNDQVINIVGVDSVKDGKMVLKTDTGTIDSSDVSYATEAEAFIYKAVAKLGASPASSWAMINGFKEADGVSAQDYAHDISLAYKYGKWGFKNGLSQLDLTSEQKDMAYQKGREDAAASVKPTKQASAKSTLSEKNAGKKIIFEGFTYNEKHATDTQKASMAAIDTISKMSSLEVHVYQSVKKNGKLYAVVNGKERLAPNGYFTDGNKIYIDINAGNAGEGAMLFTMSHEIGHYIAEWNAKDFKAISDFLFEHYSGDVPIYDLIEQQKKKLKASYERDGKAIPSDAALEKAAQEELVCDMLSRMLADKNAYDKLMALKKKDLNLFQKLGQAIKKALAKLAEIIGVYDYLNPDFQYAASKETFGEEAFRQLQDLYLRAFVQADANYQAAEVQKNTTQEGDVKYSFIGRTADGAGIYKTNYPPHTPKSVKQADLIELVQNVWSSKPITLTIVEDGRYVDITAKFNPELKERSDLSKIAFGNRKGTAAEQRMTLDLASDLYQIASEARFNYSKDATPKPNNPAHDGVTKYHYFLTNLVYKDNDGNYTQCHMNIDVKRNAEGDWFYSFAIEKGSVPQTLLAAVTEESATLPSTTIPDSGSIVKNESAEALDVEVDAKTESVAPSTVMSERTWTESDYVQEREKAAKEIAQAIGVSKEKAEAYIDSVNSIAKMIAEDRVRLDYFSSPGRSSFVGNVEYGGSFDFSTLCKKRRLLTGTFTAIQKALPNTALTANEILDIRNRMKKANLEVSCGLCYVEGSRANMGQFAKEFLKLYKQYYPDSWQPNMADVNTPEGIEWVRINHPEVYEQYEYFWNHYGTLKPGDKNLFASQQKPKLYQLHTEYKGEILDKFKSDDTDNVEDKNLNGGIRLQSFSDFEIVHLIDTMQIIMDMSRVGLAGQAYTKVPDFAWALGDTGLKINLSLIAKGVDENGKLIFDDVEGMPIDTAVALRERYSKNVGTILVAFNDAQLLAAMADDRVDFIIPFHRSQWKKSQYEAMGLPAKTKDYTYMQNEKYIKPQFHEYRGRLVKDKATNYMPNEYWDFSKSGKENAEAYLEMCARNNKRPKFYKLLQNNGDGSYSLKADGSTDGYWKLLIDFKMYDNNGVGSPQMPVKPDFNMDEATRMLNEYSGGHSNFPVAQGIVDEFVSEYKDSHKGVVYSERDSDGGALTPAQAEFFKDSAVRDSKGNLIVMYHGTNNPTFTIFDPSASDDKISLFFTSDPDVANTYTNLQDSGKDVDVYNLITEDSTAEQFNAAQKKLGGGIRIVKITDALVKEMRQKANKGAAEVLGIAQEVVDLLEQHNAGGEFTKDIAAIQAIIDKGADATTATDISKLRDAINEAENSARFLKNGKEMRQKFRALTEGKYNMYGEVISNKLLGNISQDAIGKYTYTEKTNWMPTTLPRDQILRGKLTPMTEREAVAKAIDRSKWTSENTLGNRYKVYLNIKNPYIIDAGTHYEGKMDKVRLRRSYTDSSRWMIAFESKTYGDVTEFISAEDFDKFLDTSLSAEVAAEVRAQIEANNKAYTEKYEDDDYRYVDHDIRLKDVKMSYTKAGSWNHLQDKDVARFMGHMDDDADVLTRDVAKYAKFKGYDGVIFKNMKDTGGYAATKGRGGSTVAVAFSSEQVKSVDNKNPTSDPDTRYSERDTDYLDAVNRGDMVTAQRLVDRTAKDAGYATIGYHGSRTPGFTVVDKYSWLWMARDKRVADTYGTGKDVDNTGKPHDKRGVYSVAYNLGNNLQVYADGNSWGELPVTADEYPGVYADEETGEITTNAMAEWAERNGYDSITFIDIEDGAGIPTTVDVVFNPNRDVKSADPVTYDDKGNIIPLSERFNPAKKDIRYQERTEDSVSNRSLLANAFEGVAQDQIEAQAIQEYKGIVPLLDKEERKLQRLNEQIKELSFGKGPRDTKKISALREEATKTANRITIYDKQLLRLEASKPLQAVLDRERKAAYKRAEQKGKETLAAYKAAVMEEHKQAAEEWRESRKQAVAKVRETSAKRDAREKLQKVVLDTVKWITYPAKTDVKCPDILKKPYADFLNGIDLSSKRLAKGGDPTKNDLRMANAMDSLATALDKIMTAQDPSTDVDKVLDTGYLDLPANFVKQLRDMAENIKGMMVEGDYVVNSMTAAEVRQLSQMIRTLNHAIKTMSKLYANLRFSNIEALGYDTMEFVDALGEIEKTGGLKDFVQWDNALPYYAFKRFGKGGESVFEALMDSQDKLAFLAKEIFDFQEKTWTGKEAKAWSEDTRTITLPNGNDLTLTTADAMSIYCLSRREHAVPHLLGGGIRVMGIQKGSKKAKDSRSLLTIEDIDAIVSSLTDRQKQVAEAMQEFMSTVCSEWGNEISMKRFLTKEFTEKFYFPIESNDENLATKDPAAQQSDLFRLLNISATKPLTEGANNEVIIRNVFDVFTGHASDMARLNAYGMGLLDYMKWLNYREKSVNEDGQINVVGVRKSMEKAYGKAANSYLLNLVKDVNGRPSDGGDPSILMKWMRTAKTASVGSSLRVATLQITSYPRASLVLSPKSLALGLTKKPNIKKAMKYCGIALWKSFGFYDTNISRSIEDQMKGVTDVRQKLIELSLKGAEIGDAVTWGALWNACEYEVAATRKFKVGTEEFNQAVGKKLREVVYSTQVVDSMLTRSQIMRSKRGMAQEAAAFMSEPTLSANILMDAGFQFNAEKRRTGNAKAAWRKTGAYVGRAVAVYAIGQLSAALLEGLWDAWRDEDDEEFWKKYMDAFVENLVLDLAPFNKIPIVSDVFEAALAMFGVGFYSSDKMSTTWLTQAVSAADAWKEVIGGESSMTVYNAIYKTMRALSSFFGVSVSGVMREGVALWNNTAGAYDSTLKIRTWDLSKTALAGEALDAIIDGNHRQAESIKAQFPDEDSYHDAMRTAIKDRFAAGQIDSDTALQYLVDYAGMDEDDAYWKVQEWMYESETGDDYAKYGEFFTAVETGKNLKAVIKQYTDNGVTTEALATQITNHFKPIYMAMSASEREKLKGYLLNAYGLCGVVRADAEEKIAKWQFEGDHPELVDRITYTQYKRWETDGKPNGVSIDLFVEVSEFRDDGTSNSAKSQEEVAAYINSLPISTAQKDALWCCFWKASTLKNAPWH